MLSDMTPRPWQVVRYGDGDSLVICQDEAGEKRIAFMAVPGSRFEDERKKTWKRIKADAQAISALPELIEALEPFARMAAAYDPDEGDDEDCAWAFNARPTIGQLRKARAALAKAGA